jgi:UDP-4-amino-4,6-dideoxy-N-acetyl-beta-L-altrosamine transaminase
MAIKYIPYGKQSIDNDDIQAVVRVLKSDWLTQGPMIQRFEESLAKYCTAKYAVAVSSGTAALHLACLAAGLKKDDEAITSPITFLATPNAVLYTGARPVFADIDYDTINIAPEEIAGNIGKKTKAILPVHFRGLPCDMPTIAKLAKRHNLIVIEDACHALGAKYKADGRWIRIGSCEHSDMTVFSFHPVKHITTGEGGAILTNKKGLYDMLIALRNHGIAKKDFINNSDGEWYYEMQFLGHNYRMTDMQAALGLSQLRKIGRFIKKRRDIARFYDKAFKGNLYFDVFSEEKNIYSAYHLYCIRLKDGYKNKKREIFLQLRRIGLGVQVHYIPVYLQPYYQGLGYSKGKCPNAEDFYKGALSIPIYPALKDRDAGRVAGIIKKVLRE